MTMDEKLDLILNELTELKGLKDEVNSLKDEVNSLKDEVNSLKGEVNSLKGEIQALKSEMGTMKDEVKGLRDEVKTLRAEFYAFKDDIRDQVRSLANAQAGFSAELKVIKNIALDHGDRLIRLEKDVKEIKVELREFKVEVRERLVITIDDHSRRIYALEKRN